MDITPEDRKKLVETIKAGNVTWGLESEGCMPTTGKSKVDVMTVPFKHLGIRGTWDRDKDETFPEHPEHVWKASKGFEIGWGIPGCGFGGITVNQLKESGQIEIQTECMGGDFARRCLENLGPDMWKEVFPDMTATDIMAKAKITE